MENEMIGFVIEYIDVKQNKFKYLHYNDENKNEYEHIFKNTLEAIEHRGDVKGSIETMKKMAVESVTSEIGEDMNEHAELCILLKSERQHFIAFMKYNTNKNDTEYIIRELTNEDFEKIKKNQEVVPEITQEPTPEVAENTVPAITNEPTPEVAKNTVPAITNEPTPEVIENTVPAITNEPTPEVIENTVPAITQEPTPEELIPETPLTKTEKQIPEEEESKKEYSEDDIVKQLDKLKNMSITSVELNKYNTETMAKLNLLMDEYDDTKKSEYKPLIEEEKKKIEEIYDNMKEIKNNAESIRKEIEIHKPLEFQNKKENMSMATIQSAFETIDNQHNNYIDLLKKFEGGYRRKSNKKSNKLKQRESKSKTLKK